MKPLNLDNSPCSPISSNCVIWQGPNIPCIKLCTGDTVSDVVFKLATELCDILDQLNIDSYDLACLNIPCPPDDFQSLIQILINKICELENIPVPPPSPDGGECPTNCIVAVADCLGGGTDNLLSYVQTVANKICDLIVQISTIEDSISAIDITLLDLQEQINDIPVYSLPDVTAPCPIDGNTTARLDIMFEALLTEWCDLISALGNPTDIAASLNPACTLTDIISEPGWVNPIGSLADAINNIWVSICYFYNKPIPTTEVTGSSGITVTSSTVGSVTTYDVSLTSPLSTLMPTGSVLPWAGTSGTPPVGWLFCDGTVYDGSDPVYNALFTVIGTAYGAAPLGFFAVPDMASSIPVGKGPIADGYDLTVIGTAGGNRAETLLDAQIPPHTHDLSAASISGTTGSAGTHNHEIWADPGGGSSSGAINLIGDPGSWYNTGTNNSAGPPDDVYIKNAGAHTHSFSGSITGTTGDGSPALQGLPHGNMQPFVVMQYIIKL